MFLLTNRIGSYTLLANKPVSRYSGIFFREDKKVYKVIEDIKIDPVIGDPRKWNSLKQNS